MSWFDGQSACEHRHDGTQNEALGECGMMSSVSISISLANAHRLRRKIRPRFVALCVGAKVREEVARRGRNGEQTEHTQTDDAQKKARSE